MFSVGTNSVQWFVCFSGLWLFFLSQSKSHFGFCYFMPPSSLVLLLRHLPLFEPPPVSSRCHFAFHPHPLVRISAALLWVSVGEYRSLWVVVSFAMSCCACSNTLCPLCGALQRRCIYRTCHFPRFPTLTGQEWQIGCVGLLQGRDIFLKRIKTCHLSVPQGVLNPHIPSCCRPPLLPHQAWL